MSTGLISDWKKMSTYYSMICPDGVGSVSNIPYFNSPFVRFSLTQPAEKIREAVSRIKKVAGNI